MAGTKKIFLLDASGALLTALFLSAVLANFEPVFGMPKKTLYLLSTIALLYAIYSAACYSFVRNNWLPYLKAIIIANIIYGCITAGIVYYYRSMLTIPGIIYFLLEIIVMTGLILLEIKVYSKERSRTH